MNSTYYQGKINQYQNIKNQLSGIISNVSKCISEVSKEKRYTNLLTINKVKIDDGIKMLHLN